MGSGGSSEEKREPTGRYLVNGGNLSEKPTGGGGLQGPHGPGAAARARTANAGNAAKSNDSVSVAARRRAATQAAMGDEADLRALTKNADPTTLKVLQLIQEADALPTDGKAAEKIRLLQQCYPLLQQVPSERFDHVAMMVYQKEGEVYHKSHEIESAKESYARAITLAEKRVARGDKDLYMVLKRYVLAMVGLARIWYEHERDVKGFTFADAAHPRIVAVDPNAQDDAASDHSSGLSSLASTLTSGGSVFSLNQEILKSMAPRAPRSQTGPNIQRVKMQAPHEIKGTQFTVEDEIALRSKMTRELVASPCELLLLRCCEVVELGLNCQSELLIPPTIELAQIYEDLQLYSRALLLVRKCLGILCSVFDYDHPWVIELMERADRLNALREEQLRNEAATKIQATWKMHCAMADLEDALGHPVKRHVWIPRKYRTTPEINFLDDFVDDMPEAEEEEAPLNDDVIELPYVPEAERGPDGWPLHPAPAAGGYYPDDIGNNAGAPYPDDDDGDRVVVPREPGADPVVVYDPVVHEGEVVTYTTMVPNARVVGTTQDTETDTHVQPTEYGDLVTVRTTTVTKTVTENLDSDDEAGDRPAQCPRCLEEQPPPVCPACAYAFPPLTCVACDRDLPFPDPLDPKDPSGGGADKPWPPQPVCRHCQTVQPARPPVPATCPQCRAPQSQAPLTCPFCVPPSCPRCHGDQPGPACEGCGYEFPPSHCVTCRMPLPFSAPPPPPQPQSQQQQPPHPHNGAAPGLPPSPPVQCEHCHTTQPYTPPRPLTCPRCNYRQPLEPYHCPLCGYAGGPLDGPGTHAPPLEQPLCPRCHAPQPPPTCQECGCVQPPPTCVHCHRDLPPPDPATTSYGRPWPQDPRAPAQLPSRPICNHCGTRQPPAPPVQPRCPQCHATQPSPQGPAECPYCHYGAPEATAVPPLDDIPRRATRSPSKTSNASRGPQTPRTPVPPRCPSCNLAQPAPKCQSCGYTVPPPRCPHCYVEQPYPPPCDCDDTHANHPPPPYCWNCGVQQPTPQQQMQPDPKRPGVCPKCKGDLPARPPPCPYCGFGEPYNEGSYYPESDVPTPSQHQQPNDGAMEPVRSAPPAPPPGPRHPAPPHSHPHPHPHQNHQNHQNHHPSPPLPAPQDRHPSHHQPHPPPHRHRSGPTTPPRQSGTAPRPEQPENASPVKDDPTAPPRCPQCRLAQPTPMCTACGCDLPHPYCPHCRAAQPFPPPGAARAEAGKANHPPPNCAACGTRQPPLHSSRRQPLRCPNCRTMATPQATAPPCPFCGYGEPTPTPTPTRPQSQSQAQPSRNPRGPVSSSSSSLPAPRRPSDHGHPPYRPSNHKGNPSRTSPMDDLLAPHSHPNTRLPLVRRPSSTPASGVGSNRPPSNGGGGGANQPPMFRVVRNYTVEKTRLRRKYTVDNNRVEVQEEVDEDLSISTPGEPDFLPALGTNGSGREGAGDVQVTKETQISADGKTQTVTKTTTRRIAAPENGLAVPALPMKTEVPTAKLNGGRGKAR